MAIELILAILFVVFSIITAILLTYGYIHDMLKTHKVFVAINTALLIIYIIISIQMFQQFFRSDCHKMHKSNQNNTLDIRS